MTASTKRRARRQALQAVTTPEPGKSCESCSLASDDPGVLENWGDNFDYWLCTNIPECNDRALEAHRRVHQDDAAQPTAEAAAEKSAEVSQ